MQTSESDPVSVALDTLTEQLRWRGGQTNLWPLLSDPLVTETVVQGLCAAYSGDIDVVLGPDPGGVLFGPLVARLLGVAFAPVCRDRQFFFQGPHETVTSNGLYVHRAALADSARVLVIDDWSETGGTLAGVGGLVAATKADLVAVTLLVDSLPQQIRDSLRAEGVQVRGLATPNQLRAA